MSPTLSSIINAPMMHFLNVQKATRQSQLEVLRPPAGSVVFIGDSITEQGNWDEWFPELRPINRGIGGDTVGGVSDRLEGALGDPTLVSLLIGTNDLGGVGLSRDVDAIAGQTANLLAKIRRHAPDSVLLVNSVMPRQRKYVDRIRRLNGSLELSARAVDATYVDLWPALADGRGGLRAEYTIDGLHLNGPGYRTWVEVLQPLLPASSAVEEPSTTTTPSTAKDPR